MQADQHFPIRDLQVESFIQGGNPSMKLHANALTVKMASIPRTSKELIDGVVPKKY